MVSPVPENSDKAITRGKPAEYAEIDGLQFPNRISLDPDCPELPAVNERLARNEGIKQKIQLLDGAENRAE